MALAAVFARATQRSALIDGHVIAHFRRLSDYHAHAVIDKHAMAQLCLRMNFYAGKKARQRGIKPAQPLHMMHIQPMRPPVPAHRMKAGIVPYDFPGVSCGRVALFYGVNIFPPCFEKHA